MSALLKNSLIAIVGIIIIVFVYMNFSTVPVTKVSNNKNTINNLSTSTNAMPDQNEKLQIVVVKEGEGAGAQNGQTVTVDYTGKLVDGTVFDSSIPRGEPFVFSLGKGQVIKGWDLGLLNMKVGEERTLTIPPELAYGASGIGGVIPGNATLIFEVTMRAIK